MTSSRLATLLRVVGVAALATTLSAQRVQPPLVANAADVELWAAALEQIQREQRKDLAIGNETLPSADFRGRLRDVTREQVLIDDLLKRNEPTLRFSSAVTSTVELVDASSVRKAGRAEFDMDVIRARFGQRNQRLVRLSLPVFSDDGMRALVFTWTAGGFDDLSGGGYVFQKKQGSWIVVDYLALWIT